MKRTLEITEGVLIIHRFSELGGVVITFTDGITSSRFTDRLESLFADSKTGVVLSSVHKMKGGEANRVFVLDDNGKQRMYPMVFKDSPPWAYQQELNIINVALSRAKKELYIVCKEGTKEKTRSWWMEGGLKRAAAMNHKYHDKAGKEGHPEEIPS